MEVISANVSFNNYGKKSIVADTLPEHFRYFLFIFWDIVPIDTFAYKWFYKYEIKYCDIYSILSEHVFYNR